MSNDLTVPAYTEYDLTQKLDATLFNAFVYKDHLTYWGNGNVTTSLDPSVLQKQISAKDELIAKLEEKNRIAEFDADLFARAFMALLSDLQLPPKPAADPVATDNKSSDHFARQAIGVMGHKAPHASWHSIVEMGNPLVNPK